jgi:hypothetical protein
LLINVRDGLCEYSRMVFKSLSDSEALLQAVRLYWLI